MKINIKSTGLDLTPSLVAYIEEKVGSLDHFISDKGEHDGEMRSHETVEAFVEVARTTKHHRQGEVFRAEINVKVGGKLFRTEEDEWDVRLAVDAARDEMKRELVKQKELRETKVKRGARSLRKSRSLSPLARFRGKE